MREYPRIGRYPISDATFDVGVAWWGPSLSMLYRNVRCKKWIVGVYDCWSWRANSPAHTEWVAALAHADFLAVANEQLLDEFRGATGCASPAVICEDGVDTRLFTPQPLPEVFTAGWAGNSNHGTDDLKGLRLIREACERAETPLVVQDFNAPGGPIAHDEMPGFYKRISVYVSASKAEGTPNTVLEAAACGRGCITPRQGITHRVVVDGVSGLFVERTVGGIAEALTQMRCADLKHVGRVARCAAEAHDWRFKLMSWRTLLGAATA